MVPVNLCTSTITTPGVRYTISGVFLSSRVTGACPVTTDLIMRVNVRTTTPTPPTPPPPPPPPPTTTTTTTTTY